jgi:hypothetical protein
MKEDELRAMQFVAVLALNTRLDLEVLSLDEPVFFLLDKHFVVDTRPRPIVWCVRGNGTAVGVAIRRSWLFF